VSTVKKSKEDLLRVYLIAGADTAVSFRSYLSLIPYYSTKKNYFKIVP
jgi:hypothetical protein